MQKVIYTNEIQEYTQYINQEVIDYIKEGQTETYESFVDFSLIAFDWYDIYDLEKEPAQILIYVDEDDLFFLCENEVAYRVATGLFVEAAENEKTMYLFFKNLLKGNGKFLETLEERISRLDDAIMDGTQENAREEIVDLRYQVLQLKKYYEQLDFLMEELCDNDNDLLSDACLKYFEILKNKTTRFVATVMNLREFIVQVRESYQAQIDIEQNRLMKVFTLVTSIFLPLTLIAGWYGMNLKMPETQWTYGYPIIIAVNVIVCVIWYIIFRKKGWFE